MARPPRIDFTDAIYHVTSRYAMGWSAFAEQTEELVERQRTERVQDENLALPRWTVPIDEIDAAVARHYRIESAGVADARSPRRIGQAGGRRIGLPPFGPHAASHREALRAAQHIGRV